MYWFHFGAKITTDSENKGRRKEKKIQEKVREKKKKMEKTKKKKYSNYDIFIQ